MESQSQLPESYSKVPLPDTSSFKTKQIARTIASILPHRTKKPLTFSKKHIDRYLYTFAFEIGTDLPSDQTLKNIYKLLAGTQEVQNNPKEGIEEKNMHILIEVCLNLYQQAKKTAIGGIFERIVMGLKQSLYYTKLSSFSEQETV